jgi:hypothetical protein
MRHHHSPGFSAKPVDSNQPAQSELVVDGATRSLRGTHVATPKPAIHTIRVTDGWAIEIEGEQRLGRLFPTEHEAVVAGRLLARRDKTQHIVHREDGTISERQHFEDRSDGSPARKAGAPRVAHRRSAEAVAAKSEAPG